MSFIYKLKTKFEIYAIKGIISEIMCKADWNINNLNSVELSKVKKMLYIIDTIENNM